MREYGDKPLRSVNARVIELVGKPWLTQIMDGHSMGRLRAPSADMTTNGTVAEIEIARGTALGIDRHLSVQLSNSGPPFGNLAVF